MCEKKHGNNNFYFDPTTASNKAHIDFSRSCNCAVCGQQLYNLGRSVSILLNYLKDKAHPLATDWVKWAKSDIQYYMRSIRKNNSLHVIEGCHIFTTCPPPEIEQDWVEHVVEPDENEMEAINKQAEILLAELA